MAVRRTRRRNGRGGIAWDAERLAYEVRMAANRHIPPDSVMADLADRVRDGVADLVGEAGRVRNGWRRVR